VPATKGKLPVELVFYCAFKKELSAFEFEKYLKSGSGRAFMNKRLFR
jgi:predicted GIY-YIG superfamily endonuclease